jgi:hypothetical protein
MEGLLTLPPKTGHSSPRILKRELLPHPFGPVISKFIPGWISKFIDWIRVSPFGERIGTLSKMILSLITTSALL